MIVYFALAASSFLVVTGAMGVLAPSHAPLSPTCDPCPAGAPAAVPQGAGACTYQVTFTGVDGKCKPDLPDCVPDATGCKFTLNVIVTAGASCCPLFLLADNNDSVILPVGPVHDLGSLACAPTNGNPNTYSYNLVLASQNCDNPWSTVQYDLSCGACPKCRD